MLNWCAERAHVNKRWGCLKSWLLFRHTREFKIKSLYSNDLILNIASKLKETIQKLKFLDSPLAERLRTATARLINTLNIPYPF